jgi:hypothetical protein
VNRRMGTLLMALRIGVYAGSIALVAVVTIAATATPLAALEPGTAQRLDSLFITVPHASFEWVAAEGVSDRVAMKVPVRLDGEDGWMQLDTGLDATVVYGNLAEKRGWETHEGMYHVPALDIGSIALGPIWLRARGDIAVSPGSEGQSLGSLGLDILVGYVVVIDYPGRRLTLLRPGQVPRWMWQHTTWAPAELRDAKLFLNVILGGKSLDGVFFDTGASAFEMTVDLETWRDLTGRAGPEEASVRWTVASWGNSVTAIGAPARGPLVVGSARIEEPRVFYIEEQPNLFAGWPFPAKGLVGSAPFWDRVVILDLGIRPRFGLLE